MIPINIPVRPPLLLKCLFPGAIWRIPDRQRTVYLTFDDGPTPGVTEIVLDILKTFDAKATFFCIGSNVIRYPALYRRILDEGHKTGNHTFCHLNGFKTDKKSYLHDISRCSELVEGDLFRPPYGRMSLSQYFTISRHYRIMMWDVLSMDYDQRINPEKVSANVLKNIRSGSVVVFHDSLKASGNLLPALPLILKNLSEATYRFGLPK